MLKQRSYATDTRKGRQKTFVNGSLTNDILYECTFLAAQKVSSNGHAWPPRKGTAHRDHGGGFLSQRAWCDSGGVDVDIKTGSSIQRTYQGPMFAWTRSYTNTAGDFLAPSSDAQMAAFGATGISRALPTNPLSGMGQFLGELRDMPNLYGVSTWKARAGEHRRQWRKFLRTGPSRSAADAYLNTMFGWIPLLSDIKDFFNVARNADKHIAQYVRNSGRHVRRRVTIFDDSSTTVSEISDNAYAQPSVATQLYTSSGRLVRTVRETKKIWFSGAFTYYLPEVKNRADVARYGEALASKLYGLRLTPDLLWQLAPWSWAADWIGNTGDVIHNWSAFQNDGLVMHYGYVMEHKRRDTTYALTGCGLQGRGTVNLTQNFGSETKSRMRATPYGFGLNPGSFSARQWSIIAALGISRAPRSLNF